VRLKAELDGDGKARRKDQRTRLRRARAALRKLEKAQAELERLGELTDWERDFIASVSDRLDKYDSAFANPELGGRLEALSARQKQVLAVMRRKIRDKAKQAPPQMLSSPENKTGFPSDEPPATQPGLRLVKGGKS